MICEYLEDALGGPSLYPRDPAEKAIAWLRAHHRVDANPGVEDGPMHLLAEAMRGYYRAGAASCFAAAGGPASWRRALKTTIAEHPSIDLAPIVIDEIQLLGSRCGPFAPALAALADGSVDTSALVEGRYALADGVEAMERAAQRGARKVLIDCR